MSHRRSASDRTRQRTVSAVSNARTHLADVRGGVDAERAADLLDARLFLVVEVAVRIRDRQRDLQSDVRLFALALDLADRRVHRDGAEGLVLVDRVAVLVELGDQVGRGETLESVERRDERADGLLLVVGDVAVSAGDQGADAHDRITEGAVLELRDLGGESGLGVRSGLTELVEESHGFVSLSVVLRAVIDWMQRACCFWRVANIAIAETNVFPPQQALNLGVALERCKTGTVKGLECACGQGGKNRYAGMLRLAKRRIQVLLTRLFTRPRHADRADCRLCNVYRL